MNFGEIFTKAWKIIWRHKILWIFGILSSCGQGSGGNGGNGANAGIQYSGGSGDFPPALENFFENLGDFFLNIQGWEIAALILGSILFTLIMVLIFAAIRTIGRIGLILGTVQGKDLINGEPAVQMSFGSLFNSGKPFFWRILGFNLLAGIAVFIIILLLISPLIAITVLTAGIGLFCLIPLICLLIPVGWLVGVLFEQVNIAIVVEDLDILKGLTRGWEVLRDNIGEFIFMGLILGIGGGILNIVLALPMITVTLPLIIGVMGGAESGSDIFFSGGLITSMLCCAVYLPVLILVSGILQSYIKTAWTLTYLQVTGNAAPEAELSGENRMEWESDSETLPESA